MNLTCKEAYLPLTVHVIKSLRTAVGQLDSNMQTHFHNSSAEPKSSGLELWPSGSSLVRAASRADCCKGFNGGLTFSRFSYFNTDTSPLSTLWLHTVTDGQDLTIFPLFYTKMPRWLVSSFKSRREVNPIHVSEDDIRFQLSTAPPVRNRLGYAKYKWCCVPFCHFSYRFAGNV